MTPDDGGRVVRLLEKVLPYLDETERQMLAALWRLWSPHVRAAMLTLSPGGMVELLRTIRKLGQVDGHDLTAADEVALLAAKLNARNESLVQHREARTWYPQMKGRRTPRHIGRRASCPVWHRPEILS